MSADPDPLPGTHRIIRFGLYALLILSPLPFGSVEAWAVLGIQMVAAALAGLAAFVVYKDPGAISGVSRWVWVGVGGLVAIGVVQWIPLPAGWTALVARPTAEVREALATLGLQSFGAWNPQSLEPPATLDALLRLVAYVLIGLAAVVSIRSRREIRQACVVMVGCAAFNALYGAAEYLSGHQHIFWYAKKYFVDEASGTFINRNHFAAYLAILLPFALGLAMSSQRRGVGARPREVQPGMLRPRQELLLRGFGLFAVAAIWVGIVLSYSRTGLAVGLCGTVLTVWVVSSPGWRARVALVLAVVPVVWLLTQEVRAPAERFLAPRDEITSLSGRVPVWRSTAEMTRQHAVAGVGMGTYEQAFPRYRASSTKKRWEHAHNDWLQAVNAIGFVGFGAAAIPWVLLIWSRPRGSRRPTSETVFAAIAGVSLVAVAIAATFDFALRIPAIPCAVVVAVSMGMVRGRWQACRTGL